MKRAVNRSFYWQSKSTVLNLNVLANVVKTSQKISAQRTGETSKRQGV
jgi:hypothetical protein